MDGYTLDLTPLSDVCANITTIRLINPSNADVYDYDTAPYFMRDRARKPSFDPEKITVSIRNCHWIVFERISQCSLYILEYVCLQTEAALIQDAVTVFAKAFGDNATFIDQFYMNPTTCYTYFDNQGSSSGKDVLNKVDEVHFFNSCQITILLIHFQFNSIVYGFLNWQNTVRGLTEEIRFDENGLRDLFYVEVLELSRSNLTGDSYNKIAIYDTKSGIQLLRNFSNFEEQATLSMQAKLFKVIMREGMPHLRKK